MNAANEIILYKPNDIVQLEVRLENESVWLNRQQMSVLFERDVKTIGKHINNALKEELAYNSVAANFSMGRQQAVVANFATTAADGKNYQVEHYSLDVIVSVGYRVKSSRGVMFRAWANSVLKEYLLRGYAVNQRFALIDNTLSEHKQMLLEHQKQIDFILRTELPPREGVFFNGQIFDAYKFVCDLITKAKERIVVIDNYVDDSILTLLTKRRSGVEARIVVQKITATLQLDLQKHNAQYTEIFIDERPNTHDRFIIIDNDLYHIGASLKDLGKKLFAFSKMEMTAVELLQNI